MIDSYTIVFSGLGGQGLIRLLQIIGSTLVRERYKVTTSETHGLSQRGGKVMCFLRFGTKIHAPIPIITSADMIVATEKSCVLDVLKYAKPDKSTILVVSTYENRIFGKEYPSEDYLLSVLRDNSENLYFIPAMKITEDTVKNSRTMNIVLLGFFSKLVPIEEIELEKSLKEHFSQELLPLNSLALKKGIEYNIFNSQSKEIEEK